MKKIDKQLAEYRARKHASRLQVKQHDNTDGSIMDTNNMQMGRTSTRSMVHKWMDSVFLYAENTRLVRIISNNASSIIIFLLKVLLWILLFSLFLYIEFGAIFFMFSIFYLMYMTMTNGRRRQEGELSAYSVFNADLERIDGTFTTEQFERELLGGAGSIK